MTGIPPGTKSAEVVQARGEARAQDVLAVHCDVWRCEQRISDWEGEVKDGKGACLYGKGACLYGKGACLYEKEAYLYGKGA